MKESLQTRADAFGFADKIGQILIPTEEVVELRNGTKVTSKRLVYPGYVLSGDQKIEQTNFGTR